MFVARDSFVIGSGLVELELVLARSARSSFSSWAEFELDFLLHKILIVYDSFGINLKFNSSITRSKFVWAKIDTGSLSSFAALLLIITLSMIIVTGKIYLW